MSAVYVITFIVAACSLLYELLIAQTVSFFAANTVVWYSLTAGFYLGAMGLGAMVCHRIFGRGEGWRGLLAVELWLSLAGSLSVILVSFGHILFSYYAAEGAATAGAAVFFGISLFTVLVIGFLTGLELPLLIRLGRERSGVSVTNRVLAVDYFGALAAGFLFPLVLLPRFDLLALSWAIALLNVAVAVILLVAFVPGKPAKRTLLPVGFIFGFIVLGLLNKSAVEQYFLKKFYFPLETADSLRDMLFRLPERADIERRRSVYQTIDIVTLPDEAYVSAALMTAYSRKYDRYPDFPRFLRLYIDGNFQLGTSYEDVYHEYLTHVPIILTQTRPRHILVLGAGDGMLVRELLKYDFVEKITVVDIDPAMIRLALHHPTFRAMNRASLEDPRVEVIHKDAYHFIRNTKDHFAAIYSDVPIPNDYNLSKMYSREFYSMLRKRLTPEGYAVFEAPGSAIFSPHSRTGRQFMLPESDWPIYYHTLKAAGFETIVPYVSDLELDNPIAIQRLREIYGPYEQGRGLEIAVENTIENYVQGLQEGFILVMARPQVLEKRYSNPGVELHVLNEERFLRAFRLTYPDPDELDHSVVNSIMRPTLPIKDFWYLIKMP